MDMMMDVEPPAFTRADHDALIAHSIARVYDLTARLRNSARGNDPPAFEHAVCDAFAALGFVATHVGGERAPDGYLDAALGVLGYRVMLECKTASGVVAQPDAAKYGADYGAQYATLIGPAFAERIALGSELKMHGVGAFTVDDVVTLLERPMDLVEIRPLLEPGFADDRLTDLEWERDHGFSKRVAVVINILAEAGWQKQTAAARSGDPADAPMLTEDAAMTLVDQVLVGTYGSQQPCTREQVRAAFAYLTSSIVRRATWAASDSRAIVLCAPSEATPHWRSTRRNDLMQRRRTASLASSPDALPKRNMAASSGP